MLESEFKKYAKERIIDRFPSLDFDFVIGINRSNPDLFILAPLQCSNRWAALEFKQSEDAPHRPNQDYHIERLNKKGYATFVFPENLEEVLNELEVLFAS